MVLNGSLGDVYVNPSRLASIIKDTAPDVFILFYVNSLTFALDETKLTVTKLGWGTSMLNMRRALPFAQGLATASVMFLLFPGSGWASGFYLQDQSTRGTGRAYSGEAADQGAESLWWNPASISGLDHSDIDSSLAGILVWSKARDQGSTIDRFGTLQPVGGSSRSSHVISNGLLPSMAAALRLDDQWSVGLAVSSPFSFITQYNQSSWARYAALTSRLETIDLQPTLAWRPTSWLGIGAGPNIEHTLAALSSSLPNLSAAEGDGTETFHGQGWNVGYNVGLQLHLLEDRLTFGAAYRSRIEHSLSGSLDVIGLSGLLAGQNFHAGNGVANFTTPWAATFAVRYRVTPRLTLDAQVVHTGWSELDVVRITRPVAATTSEAYNDVTSGAIGLDYAVNPRWVVRAGIQYDPTPVPSGDLDPRVPDANRFLFALGTSLKVTQRLTVDAGVIYIDADTSHINRDASTYAGTPVATPIQLRGEVKSTALVLALGTRLQF